MANPTLQNPLTPPTPSSPEPTAVATPKLRMCIKRSDDHFVPMIAIDELPSWIVLKGVPMTLRGEEVLKLGLMNCGDYSRTNYDYYQVDLNEIPADFQAKNSDSTIHSRDSAATRGTPGTIGRKIYCTFWCRTGNCDYTQQGCKFLHEIPPDEATRNWMGLRDYPTWMVEEPRGPRLVKTTNADKMQEGNWRHRRTQDNQRVLPASPTPGHGRPVSHIVTSVPYSGHVQTSSLTQTPTMTTAVTGGQTPGRHYQKLNEFQAAQQAALKPAQQAELFLAPQQHFPSSIGPTIHTRPQMQPNTFDGADGNMNFQPITSEGQEVFRFQYPTNEVFSNATVVGTNERHPVPTRPAPISRPVPSAQAPSTPLKSTNTTHNEVGSSRVVGMNERHPVPTRPVLSTQAPSTPRKGNDTTNNKVFSNATVVGTNERHPVPTRQLPISRPSRSAQAPSTPPKDNDTTIPLTHRPSHNTAGTVPQAKAPAASNTTISAHAMEVNQKAFSANGSQRSTSRATSSGSHNAAASDGVDHPISSLLDGSTADTVPEAKAPAVSNTITSVHVRELMELNQNAFSANGSQRSNSRATSSGSHNAAASDSAEQTLASLVDGSTPSPPIMHRRLFVAPGEPRYAPNPVVTVSNKSRQHSRSKRGANGKGRGYGGGKARQWSKTRGQMGQEEDLVPLLATEDRSEG